MTVLALLVVVVMAMVSGVDSTTTASRRHLEADNEARRVFDRMAIDFGRMFKRPDADSIFDSIPGTSSTSGANDKMFFYSEAPTYFDTSTVSSPAPIQGNPGLIGYRVNATSWQLERLGKGLTWDGGAASPSPSPGSVVFLTFPAASASPTPTPLPGSTLAGNWAAAIGTSGNNYDDGVDADYHVLSSYVFRLEYCFALKNAPSAAQFSTTHTQSLGFNDIAAVVVAIAILDPQGRALVPGIAPGNMSALAAALPDPNFTTSPYTLMAQLWDNKIKSSTFASSLGIPKNVASQIRVYQRFFYLNTPP